SYTTLSTGPRRAGDPDGPQAYHVVILDNGRTAMLGTEFHDMLRCIRCGACINHCPIYHAVGGHAYGWVYSGPMGAVLTPALIGIEEAGHLPNASTFCGRCEEVCPMRIPLPKMMRHWRERGGRPPPGPPRGRHRVCRGGAQARGARPRPGLVVAARRRLDAASRLPGAAGSHLHAAVAGALAWLMRQMTRRRAARG